MGPLELSESQKRPVLVILRHLRVNNVHASVNTSFYEADRPALRLFAMMNKKVQRRGA